jgi:hypothetical protein
MRKYCRACFALALSLTVGSAAAASEYEQSIVKKISADHMVLSVSDWYDGRLSLFLDPHRLSVLTVNSYM